MDNGGADIVSTAYTYNRRRQPVGEALALGHHQWGLGYGYNANGHLQVHALPGGLTVDYAPNALGQPTQAGSYATGVGYFPNGTVRQFTYGNGIVRTLTPNARGLPERIRDAYGATAYHDDSLDYDQHGNVAAISDGLPGYRGDRTMTYDTLDRLTQTVSPMFGTGTYTYNALDNLIRVLVTAGPAQRDHTYGYDAGNRLNLITNTSGGGTVASLTYDAQGNLAGRNGQPYQFDHGNRLRSVPGVESYLYDGHGRRVRALRGAASIYSVYGSDGVLRYQRDERTGKTIEYVHLGPHLVAQLEDPIALSAPTLTAPGYSATGSYAVSWAQVALATKYQLQERLGDGGWSTLHDAAGTSLAVSGRAAGAWSYRVRACGAATCGDWSATATTTVQLPPAAPPVLSVPAVGLNGAYMVSWSIVVSATRYQLQERQGSGSWTMIHDAAGASLAISVQAAGNWSYRVRACNDAGCGGWSSTATVGVIHPPGSAPTLSAPATSNTGGYTVSWTGVATASRYQLQERKGNGSWTTLHDAAATSRAVSGRAAGSWNYRVRACNDAGCAAYSLIATVAVTLPPAGAPSLTAPAVNTSGSYTVSWTAVTSATRYELQERLGSGSWSLIQNSSVRSRPIAGKSAGNWGYRSRACNPGGCGGWSPAAVVKVVFPPTSAPMLSAPFDAGFGVPYVVGWTSVAGATRYELYQQYNSGPWELHYDGPATSRQMSATLLGKFGHRVRACNAGGCGPYAGVAITRVGGCGPLGCDNGPPVAAGGSREGEP